jgi:hypothetical protein
MVAEGIRVSLGPIGSLAPKLHAAPAILVRRGFALREIVLSFIPKWIPYQETIPTIANIPIDVHDYFAA